MNSRYIARFTRALLAVMLGAPAAAHAQETAVVGSLPVLHSFSLEQSGQPGSFIFAGSSFEILDASPLENEKVVKDSPFTADAVTEFVQTLSDGNRIERSYRASLARDGRGRTRREEQIALLGPLSAHGEPPTMITITDPETGTRYTVNDDTRSARRERFIYRVEKATGNQGTVRWSTGAVTNQIQIGGGHTEALPPETSGVTENLGTQQIEGVEAEGTRTTTRIPAGAIGNVQAIEIVSERWFSKELQLAVLISRRDPRSGDTTYRLTNIVRAEPPADLFTPPRDYHIEKAGERIMEIERKKIDSKPTLVK